MEFGLHTAYLGNIQAHKTNVVVSESEISESEILYIQIRKSHYREEYGRNSKSYYCTDWWLFLPWNVYSTITLLVRQPQELRQLKQGKKDTIVVTNTWYVILLF